MNTDLTVSLTIDGSGSPVIISILYISLILEPMKSERMATAFLSRQHICGMTAMPVSRCTLSAISTESILVRPDGESGNVSTSTPAPISECADSNSFSSFASNGGASSTAISFFFLSSPFSLYKNPFFFTCSASVSAAAAVIFSHLGSPLSFSHTFAIVSGLVPQQPPTMSAPFFAISSIFPAK